MAEWRERQYSGKNGRMVEWREWLHTYYLRYAHTDDDDDNDDDDDDDTLTFYSIEGKVRDVIQCPTHACTTPTP
jgi:hypothetical protein